MIDWISEKTYRIILWYILWVFVTFFILVNQYEIFDRLGCLIGVGDTGQYFCDKLKG